ncbi:hypothetical protein SNE40_021266 [Patella caerulea]|uniref:Uncharacterized protein n=1 Tax=Patella caerulea TaxID=87958 RepID=A0AAN8GCE5_PATCE
MLCDVLAGEQGPSCKDVKQIPDLKVIHVRFIDIPNSQITSSSLDLGAHNPFSLSTAEAKSSRKRKHPEPITHTGIELTVGQSQSHSHQD